MLGSGASVVGGNGNENAGRWDAVKALRELRFGVQLKKAAAAGEVFEVPRATRHRPISVFVLTDRGGSQRILHTRGNPGP